jgi:Zn-dependent protease with chaperone function
VTVPLALVALAVIVATCAPRLLAHRNWSRRSPRLGILAWQGSVLTVLAACVLLALTAVVPVESISFDVGHILHACPEVLRTRYQVLDGSWVHLASLAVATVTFLAVARALLLTALAVRRGRGRQRDLLNLLGEQRDTFLGAHGVEHDVPLAYCVPGGGGRVVVTTAAVAALDQRQLTAVMAHEYAHLDGRHDLVLFGADVAASAFPWSRFFKRARNELRLLIEMVADDEASRRSDRDDLVSALVDLGQGPAPYGAVGASGDTFERVARLLDRPPVLSRVRQVALVAFTTALTLSPWLIAIAPAWAARSGLCPVPGG